MIALYILIGFVLGFAAAFILNWLGDRQRPEPGVWHIYAAAEIEQVLTAVKTATGTDYIDVKRIPPYSYIVRTRRPGDGSEQ